MRLPAPVLAVDLGGTKLAAAVVLPGGALAGRRQVPTATGGPRAVVDQIVRLAAATLADAGLGRRDLAGAAAACPGPVDPAAGVLHNPPNLSGWGEEPIRDLLAEALDLPVRIGNDADCAALGEFACGAGRGCRHLLYAGVGTGVGGGLILDGRLWRGTGAAAEIGHLPVDPGGPVCRCGRRGCLEALASGSAIARRYAERTASGASTDTTLPLAGPGAEAVFAAARHGDAAARQVIHEAGSILGRALGGLVNLLAPERIVLGGGVALGGSDLLLPPLADALAEAAFPLLHRRVTVALANLGKDAGLVGAAMLLAENPPGRPDAPGPGAEDPGIP